LVLDLLKARIACQTYNSEAIKERSLFDLQAAGFWALRNATIISADDIETRRTMNN
jgi:hypothetical protein